MITHHRSADIASGKTIPAMRYAQEISAYIKTKTGNEVRFEMPVGGNPYRLRWTFHHVDLAALDAFTMSLRSDPDYMKLLEKNADHFIEGSATDEYWRTV